MILDNMSLLERCVDIFQAMEDAKYGKNQCMAMVFYYLVAELQPFPVWDPDDLWAEYLEGKIEICELLKTEADQFNPNEERFDD